MKSDIFGWLVRIHYQNLLKCLPHIRNGRMHSLGGQPLREGIDECEAYNGMLIVANGKTLASRLKSARVVLDNEICEFVPVKSFEEFVRYVAGQQSSEGAYVVDS